MSTTAVAKVEPPAQQQVIAMLLASGKYEVPEIAACVGCRPSEIYALQESELFQVLVAGYSKRFTPEEFDELRSLLRVDGPTNFSFLKSVREGDLAGADTKMLALRMRAAEVLFDKQVEKKSADAGPKAPVIVIDQRKQTFIQQVIEEDAQAPRLNIEVDPDD